MTATPFYDITRNTTSENFTEDAAATCRRVKPQRIVSLCFSFIAAVFLVYIVIAFCIYSYKKKLMIGCIGSRISSGDQAASVINFVTLCGAIFVLVFVTMEIPLLNPPTHYFCNIYYWIKTISYGGAVSCAYFALWYRIYSVFYKNSIIKQSISISLQVLNYMTVVFMVLMGGIVLIISFSSPAYSNMPCACRAAHSNENNLVFWIILVTCSTAFQFALLFTFIYPLYLHHKKMLNCQTDQKSIIPVVKRASVVAGVSVVSDLLNFGFGVAYKGETVYINHVVYSSNLIVNLMGVVFTFANWREKLLPCRKNND